MDYEMLYEFSRMLNGTTNTERNYDLYYDETNNPRTFTLTDKGFSYDESAFFILGGIGFTNEKGTKAPEIADLFAEFKLQGNMSEIKFRHIQQGAKNLGDLITKKRTIVFLDWLNSTERVFIHYNYVDNFYFSIVDIVDSLNYSELLGQGFNRELKDALFDVLTKDKEWFVHLMIDLKYPNITDINLFVTSIASRINEINPAGENFYQEYLRQILNGMKNKNLPFLEENVDGQLIDNFSQLYAQSVYSLPYSNHLFDLETKIKEILQDEPIMFGDKKLNYDWEDSKNNQMLQLSDLTVGILRYWTSFLNETPFEELNNKFRAMTVLQRQEIEKLQSVMNKSLRISSAFKIGTGSNSFERKVSFFLDYDFH